MASVNSRPLVLADPAMMKFQFMNAPKKAAMPVRAPRMSAMPMRTSPQAISGANQVYQPLSSMYWMKLRYQSKTMGGWPSAGTCTALVQNPLSGSPVIQVPPLILPQPEVSHIDPIYRRKINHSQANFVVLNRA